MSSATERISRVQGTSARTINLCIGGGALLLGPGLVLIGLASHEGWAMASSISAYYLFNDLTRNVFVGVLCAMGLLMSAYRGWNNNDAWDRTIAIVSWVSAWTVALVPCNTVGYAWVHFGAAGTLFIMMAAMLWWRFTEPTGDDEESTHWRWKRLRNRVYRLCAIGMTVAIGVKIISAIQVFGMDADRSGNLTFWIEVAGLTAFSVGWLTKSRYILGYQKSEGWLHCTPRREARFGVEAVRNKHLQME